MKSYLQNIYKTKKFKKINYFKYYFKNLYFINYKLILIKFHFLFNFINLKFINQKFNKFFFKFKKQNKIKNISFKTNINNYLEIKQFLFNKFYKKPYYKKFINFLFSKIKLKSLKFLPDTLPFLNLLKTQTNKTIKLDNLINDYGYIYLKSSGINTFITLTNSQGNV